MKTPPVLSKSSILSGVQCEKLLRFKLHQRDLARQVTPAEQARFDAGNEVGVAAQKNYPGGALIDAPYYDRLLAISQTNEAVEKGSKSIYEASFEHDGLWARIDVLNKHRGAWDLIEVKSTTSVKDTHYLDVAIQAYILMHQGLPMGRCYLMHLNNQCKFPNLKNLFVLEDITEEVENLIPEVQDIVEKLKDVAASKTPPEVAIGPHCNDPYGCPYMDQCWKQFPKNNVFELPRLSANKAWEQVDLGNKRIVDLDEDEFGAVTGRAIKVVKSGKPFIDKDAIQEELSEWQWPLYFFDFETLGDAIPRFKGVGPYQQVPFQYSCHVWKSPKSTRLQHFEYLHTKATDPREAIAKSIVDNFGSKGSVVAYNKGFEKAVLQKLADRFPNYRRPLENIIDRLVDPLPIFRKHVYHKDFKGSFSIKYVAPALVGEELSYENLDVADGSEAQASVGLLMRGQISDAGERERLIQNLLEYCRQDTMAMVELVRWLRKA